MLPIVQAVLIVAATIRNDRYEEMQDHSTVGEINSVLSTNSNPCHRHNSKRSSPGPARRSEQAHQRVQFSPDLVERILADAADGADTLPLLSLVSVPLRQCDSSDDSHCQPE